MDSDPAGPSARQWLSRSPAGDDRDAELTRLRERLAFYQSFEGLIQDNIARSGDLLRQAMDMRESAAADVAAAQADAARQRADDRSRYRILFSAMLDELTALQGQAERLARRLTSALDELELDLPVGATSSSLTEIDLRDDETLRQALVLDSAPFDPLTDADPDLSLDLTIDALGASAPPPERDEIPESADQSTPEPPESAAPDLDGQADTPPTPDQIPPPSALDVPEPLSVETAHDDVATDTIPDIPADIQPFTPEDFPSTRQFAADNDLALQPAIDPDSILVETPTASDEAPGSDTAPATNATIVLVHGVPRATTALSLKRYLEGLSHVGAVEPREFAEGILRLEVSGARPLAFDDLRSWSEGDSLEPIHLRDDLVEVRLAP
ncbi:MAG TPA: hypothetical protein VH482_37770 [Thermomicrobiales bacterium]|jgi:hypothetical protein